MKTGHGPQGEDHLSQLIADVEAGERSSSCAARSRRAIGARNVPAPSVCSGARGEGGRHRGVLEPLPEDELTVNGRSSPMRILLDTHTCSGWLAGDKKLSLRARRTNRRRRE